MQLIECFGYFVFTLRSKLQKTDQHLQLVGQVVRFIILLGRLNKFKKVPLPDIELNLFVKEIKMFWNIKKKKRIFLVLLSTITTGMWLIKKTEADPYYHWDLSGKRKLIKCFFDKIRSFWYAKICIVSCLSKRLTCVHFYYANKEKNDQQ